MGSTPSKPLPRLAVPAGKTRLCVSGFSVSHHTGRARAIVDSIVKTYPEEYESWFYFDNSGFRPIFLESVKSQLSDEQKTAFAAHKTSPFCWLEKTDEKPFAIGGRDRLCEWAIGKFEDNDKNAPFLKLCKSGPRIKDAFFDSSTPGTASQS